MTTMVLPSLLTTVAIRETQTDFFDNLMATTVDDSSDEMQIPLIFPPMAYNRTTQLEGDYKRTFSRQDLQPVCCLRFAYKRAAISCLIVYVKGANQAHSNIIIIRCLALQRWRSCA
ncbi:hypothetical protein PoB_003377900 [Plakobranchus ocellatus]|uniref:Uncharacterized protein n=1 Tax=Plakobranchus ocellatus TaxID=259542 RepID=A0AAV4AM13_9GAST|nr:hypothetical protein PoB_003377900 [Plakobranchus ocellatus]